MSAPKVTAIARREHDVLIYFGTRHLVFTPRIDLDRQPHKWYRPFTEEYQERVFGLTSVKLFNAGGLAVHLTLYPVQLIEKIAAGSRVRLLSQYWDAIVLHTQTVRSVFPDAYANIVVNQEREARTKLARGNITIARGAQEPSPPHRIIRIFPTRIGGM